MRGEQIRRWEARASMEVDLSSLPSGVYWLRVPAKGIYKLIKQ
jgi:hypothetical protein